MAKETQGQSGRFWALLVGINRYQSQRHLQGCVNDVEAMKVLLINQFRVPEENIRVIKDEEASRARILAEFHSFLIDNAKIQRNDQILFHFSGHGSQMKDLIGVEPDGYNETLVPYDSRVNDVFDIPDKTVAVLLDQLATKKGDQITVILDCCHSGSGTRKAIEPDSPLTRRIAADERIPPQTLDAAIVAGSSRRRVGPSGWRSNGIPYVLLAACRDREEACEHRVFDTHHEVIIHGALTYFLLKKLQALRPGTTYAELHERIATSVNAEYPLQMPQCEGQIDREVFGSAQIERDPFIRVSAIEGNTIRLEAGLVHGLAPGTKMYVYPDNVRTQGDKPDSPLATAEVIQSSPTSAIAVVIDSPAQIEIPMQACTEIVEHAYKSQLLRVALAISDEANEQRALETLREALEQSPLQAPNVRLVQNPEQAEIHVRAKDSQYRLSDVTGKLLVEPEDVDCIPAVVCALESIARFRRLARLENQERGSKLAGSVSLNLRKYRSGIEQPRELELVERDDGNHRMLLCNTEDEAAEENAYVVDVVNHSHSSIYPYVFVLNADYSIFLLYPESNQQDELRSGRTLHCGYQRPDELLWIYLDEEWNISRDKLKLIATEAPLQADDMKVFEQEALRVPPAKEDGRRGSTSPLLDLFGDFIDPSELSRTRGGSPRPKRPRTKEDWATAELNFSVVRKSAIHRLSSGQTSVDLGNGLEIEKPEAFQADMGISTWNQAARSAKGADIMPPGLDMYPDLFQPLVRPGMRSDDGDLLVITLYAEDIYRQQINEDSPLVLRLPERPDSAEDLLAVAFDGQDYLPVGFAQNDELTSIQITSIPRADVDVHGPPARKGTLNTIKLFIYKKMGRFTDNIGLQSAQPGDRGTPVFEHIDKQRFKSGDKVALFVHGFNSDTRWMVQHLARYLRDEVLPYDHFLTWDYESYGTSTSRNGENLAEALRQKCGFGPDDGITLHVYSHSMGAVVCRCMIELFGGYQFVDSMVMAGPANRGTTLATMAKGGIYLLTSLINQVSIIPPIGTVNSMLKNLNDQGLGPADLQVDSDLTRTLNSLDEPSNVPYLILAGENLPDPFVQSRLRRIAHKVLDQSLDTIFGEQNDSVIGMSSMKGVRNGAYPADRYKLVTLPCDHFHYFSLPQSLEEIKEWILTENLVWKTK